MPFPNYMGRERLWTREKVLEGLRLAAELLRGQLPCSDRDYNLVKKGHMDWPTSRRVLEYFGSMARGWLAAGAPRKRVTLGNIDWEPSETGYLLEMAGGFTLETIARHLRRSYGGCRRRLYKLGLTARANQGYCSAAEISKLYECPYHRVCRLLAAGTIRGWYDHKRNRWQVDLIHITAAEEALLRAPKGTHKRTPTDLGDYYQRYGLKRTIVDGQLVTVPIREGVLVA